MKPITEDQVVSLMRGLELREKRALKQLAAAADAGHRVPGSMTAEVKSFTPNPTQPDPVAQDAPAPILSLAAARARNRMRHTVRGVFFYATTPDSTLA